MSEPDRALNSVDKLVRAATARLEALPDPRLDAELLLASVLEVDRTELYRHPERSVPDNQLTRFQAMIDERADGVPLAYMIGTTEFWSLSLEVDERVLIPRPDTEVLVTQALKLIKSSKTHVLMDLGTGSGAVAAALAHEHPDLQIIAVDNDLDALDVARRNFKTLGMDQVSCLCADWLAPISTLSIDMIVCNPPYVDATQIETYDTSLKFEPSRALFADQAGLTELTHVAAAARGALRRGGALLLEHGFDQQQAVAALLRQYDYVQIECIHDLGGHPRVTFAFTK